MTPAGKPNNILVDHEYQQAFTCMLQGPFPRPWLETVVPEVEGWLRGVNDRSRIGLFWASDLDSLWADAAFEISRRTDGGRFISPGAFRHTLANMDAGSLALHLRITGPVMTFSLGNDLEVAENSARRFLAGRRISAAITIIEFSANPNDNGTEKRKPIYHAAGSIERQVRARYLALAP